MNDITIDAAWRTLTDFVRDELGLAPSVTLHPSTTLLADLGIDGDDGDEFMAAFAARFGVVVGDFDERRYFGPEGFFLHGLLAALFGKKRQIEPLTLGMLFMAQQTKCWESQVLANARDKCLYSLSCSMQTPPGP